MRNPFCQHSHIDFRVVDAQIAVMQAVEELHMILLCELLRCLPVVPSGQSTAVEKEDRVLIRFSVLHYSHSGSSCSFSIILPHFAS